GQRVCAQPIPSHRRDACLFSRDHIVPCWSRMATALCAAAWSKETMMYGAGSPIGLESQIYPALIARIGEDRRLTYAELRRLVVRIRREACSNDETDASGRRQVSRTVVAALGLT